MADDKASKSNIMWIKKLLNNNITRPRDGKLVDRNAVLNMIKNANIDHQFIFDNIAIIDGVASAINEISLNDYKLVISVKKENYVIIFLGEDQLGNKVILSCVDCF